MIRGSSIRAYVPLLLATLALAPGCDREPPSGPPPAAPAPDASLAAAPASSPRAVATLEELAGKVQLERAGQKKDAARGELFLKDVLETGPDGKAVVTFPGGRRLEIGPDARFVLGEDKTGLVVEVARGLVLSRVPADAGGIGKKEGVALSILTPFGLTRMGSGEHEVAVDVRKDNARVEVKLGNVEFVSRGESTRVAEGEALDVSVGQVQLARRELTLAPLVVTLVSNGGRAEVKKSGASRWRAVGRRGEALAEGDVVRVREGRSQLALAGSQTSVALEKGTELVFGKSGRLGEVEESHLDVKRGGLTLALGAGRSRVVVGDLALESNGGGQYGVVRTKDGLEVAAVTGDLTLQQGNVSQRLLAGQVARLGRDGAPVIDEADRAELMLPARNGLRLYHPGLSQVALSWGGGQPGDYRVEVASDSGFTHTVAAGRVHRPNITVALPRRGALYWRAFTPDGKTEVDKGSVFTEPEPAVNDLARLRNEVPDGAEKTTIFYQDKPPAVTFTWRAEAQAAQYRIRLFRADSLAHPVTERVGSQPSMPLEAGILSEGSYVWSVTPLSPTGEELRGGKMNKLELVYDNSVPNLVIASPRNGESVERGRVHAAGVVPVGARLFINGKPAELDGKSRFDLPVTPVGHPPVLVFRLSRPPAADAYTVRVLRRGK